MTYQMPFVSLYIKDLPVVGCERTSNNFFRFQIGEGCIM